MTTYYKELRCTDDLLRECGIDYDTAYFMEYGDYPKHTWGNTCHKPTEDEIDRTDERWEMQPDEFLCMRMWRFPNWWV